MRSEYILIGLILFLLIIVVFFKPEKLVTKPIKSKIKPCIAKDKNIAELKYEITSDIAVLPETHFTLGMLLADEIDREFVPEVFRHLTTAMELVQQEDRINDDHQFMVRRAGDIHQIGMMNMLGDGDFELGLALDHAINGANNIVKTKTIENQQK